MIKVDEIKSMIETLSDEDFIQLRHWFSDKDWEKRDRQIEEDFKSGKLNFLINQALQEQDKLKEL